MPDTLQCTKQLPTANDYQAPENSCAEVEEACCCRGGPCGINSLYGRYAKADISTKYQSKCVYMGEKGHGEILLGSDFKS